uniref:Putative odorant binding protein 53 n=1 Tax=Nasonia vitripennis TaxID=7425 RepID=G8B1Q8_NASVI|nr:putative odorant binding protein 53 [Nasonia vitripennis]
MKILLFLLIFCVVGIYTQKHNDSAEKNKHAMDIEDCLNQHSNITKKGLSVKDIILKSIAPYDLGCITSCLKKKELKNGVTLNSYVIQNAYLPSTKFPDWYEKKNEDYQYVVIANRCINEAKEDECKLFMCLKAWELPFAHILSIKIERYITF